jgi:hypothetical protein
VGLGLEELHIAVEERHRTAVVVEVVRRHTVAVLGVVRRPVNTDISNDPMKQSREIQRHKRFSRT